MVHDLEPRILDLPSNDLLGRTRRQRLRLPQATHQLGEECDLGPVARVAQALRRAVQHDANNDRQNRVFFFAVERFDVSLEAGNDSVQTGDGADRLIGNGGNDTLRAGGGADFLRGGAGNDSLTGDGLDNQLAGGAWATTPWSAAAATIASCPIPR